MTLIDRLKAATGPDRELDARVHAALFPSTKIMVNYGSRDPITGAYGNVVYTNLDGFISEFSTWESPDWHALCSQACAAQYTASIDAALALVERMLPEWTGWALSTSRLSHVAENGGFVSDPTFVFELCYPDSYKTGHYGTWPDNIITEAKTIPLAILTALFTALQGDTTNADNE